MENNKWDIIAAVWLNKRLYHNLNMLHISSYYLITSFSGLLLVYCRVRLYLQGARQILVGTQFFNQMDMNWRRCNSFKFLHFTILHKVKKLCWLPMIAGTLRCPRKRRTRYPIAQELLQWWEHILQRRATNSTPMGNLKVKALVLIAVTA